MFLVEMGKRNSMLYSLMVIAGAFLQTPEMPGDAAVVDLRIAIERDENLVAAISGLHPGIAEEDVSREIVPLLVPLLSDRRPRVRIEAAELLRLIADNHPNPLADEVEAIAAAVRSATTPASARCDLMDVLAILRQEAVDSCDDLRFVIRHGGVYERTRAAVALAQIDMDDDEAVDQLIVWLNSSAAEQRWTAAHGLSVLGSRAEKAGPALAEALRDPHPAVRAYSCRAMWRISQDPMEIVQVLVDDLTRAPEVAIVRPTSTSSYWIDHVVVAATTLGEIGPAAGASTATLLRLLDSADVVKQRVALRSLVRIVDEPEKFLGELLNDSRSHLRELADDELQRIRADRTE
ncbi:MAG: hypothetical protein DWQ34_15090 [Planctomycetota bacterium]|nr:MAG: hypothetical protein DWQ34_15090 [Planctomycetota bacterium]